MRPAGFWRRAAAWSLDATLLALPVLAVRQRGLHDDAAALAAAWRRLADEAALRLVATLDAAGTGALPDAAATLGLARDWLRDPALLAAAEGLQAALWTLAGPALAAFVLLHLAWCVGFERSSWQATPGRRALGLRAVDVRGGRLGTGAALARFLAGGLSWLSLNVGHLMAAAPPAHLALHDLASRTRVVLAPGTAPRLPHWAAAWLLAVAAAALAATAWLSAGMAATLRAALERALGG